MSSGFFEWTAFEDIEGAAIGTAGFSGIFDFEKYPRMPIPAAHVLLWAIQGKILGFHLGEPPIAATGFGHDSAHMV